MASLFQGSPQTATSYATQANETPRWMQDAIYNQIQWAQNVANTPYQRYELPTVAELSPLQQQAYLMWLPTKVRGNLTRLQLALVWKGSAVLIQLPS